MRDPDKLRRSNLILVGMVLLVLLYGVITRIQSGDTSLYLFGFKLDLPFTQQETVEESAEETTEEEAAEGAESKQP